MFIKSTDVALFRYMVIGEAINPDLTKSQRGVVVR